MSPIVTRTLFAGASVALTLAMVAASAPAYATTAPMDVYRTTVQVADLDLANPAGQKTLEHRLNAAADAVCPTVGIAIDVHCRAEAIARARADIGRRTATIASVATAS